MSEIFGAVRDRDSNTCRLCGVTDGIQVHHIVFRSHGGPDEDWNLITLCARCHNRAHGLIPGVSKFPKWALLIAVRRDRSPYSIWKDGLAQTCLGCAYRDRDWCELYEQTVSYDYGCESFSLRSPDDIRL